MRHSAFVFVVFYLFVFGLPLLLLVVVDCEVVKGHVEGLVVLVVEDGVALAEGAALNILATEANVDALHQEGTESQGLGGGHVDALSGLDGLHLGGHDFLKTRVNVKVGRVRGNRLAQLLQNGEVDTSVVDGGDDTRQLFQGGKRRHS